MTPERWRQVTEVFHAALACEAPVRARYLDEACPGDPALRAEVEAMLGAHAASVSLGPASVHGPATTTLQLESGTVIGPYRIEGVIGVGGMGEVYRARDTKLGRDVAVKILPLLFSSDPERLARFDREARLLAALNHPHIAAIYGIEGAHGVPALILELIEGDTLDDRLRHGPLAVDEALPLAQQIAEALEAAHEKGIVHRDLKPANVKITRDGVVKVLDFGLAKVYAGDDAAADSVHATRSTVGTREGMILGTAAYMSPEQARGQAVDRRTDLWGFGCVLYEMITGRRAFAGDTVSDTIAAVLERTPDWHALPEKTPAGVQRLLRRCLEKDPKRRLHDIADARIELEDALRAGESASIHERQAATLARGNRLVWAVAGLAIIAAGTFYVQRSSENANVYRSSILPPPGVSFALLSPNARFALSPDGRRLAYVGQDGNRGLRLWVQPLDGTSAQPLAGTEGAATPFWSPDNRFIGFFAGGKLKTIDAAGGPPVSLADVPLANTSGATWNQDGVVLFARFGPNNPIHRVLASGGAAVPATTLDVNNGETRHAFPFFLPDGRHFLYLALGSKTGGPNSPSGIYVAALDATERKLVVPGGSNAIYAQGYLFYLRGQTLTAQPFDVGRLELNGVPVPIAEQVTVGGQTGATGGFSVSAAGVLAYQTGPRDVGGTPGVPTQLFWLDRAGRPIGMLADKGGYLNIELAPDGRRASVSLFGPERRDRDIWLFDIERGLRTRFTFDPAADELGSVWSPDGRRVVFNARRNGPFDLYVKASDGVGPEEALLSDRLDKMPLDWSSDGRFVLFATAFGTAISQAESDLWVLPLFGDRKPFRFLATPFTEGPAQFSPDGRWVAYTSNESGRDEVYVAPFPGPGGKWQISAAGGSWPRWRSDGREVFYLATDDRLMVVTVNGERPAFEVGAVLPLFDTRNAGDRSSYIYDVSPDGQRFLMRMPVAEAAPAPITLVVNWPAALKK